MDATGDRSADLHELLGLKARYFRLLDTKQWDEWRELFTDDLVFFSDPAAVPSDVVPTCTGADDFVEFVSANLTNAVSVHHGHMPEVHFTGPAGATGVWAMFDFVDTPGHDADHPARAHRGFGHYHERYARGSDGRWRISELRLTRLRFDPLPPSGARATSPEPWRRT